MNAPLNAPDRALIEAVQTNCHIVDAAQAADMTLCIYLLQMREFYRWEAGIAPMQPMAREAVGAWLTAREALWDTLAGQPLRSLPLPGGGVADPFDADGVNAALAPHGWVYGAGYTAPGRASFFLAALVSDASRAGVRVRTSGREYARGLAAPPAALQAGIVYLRQESLQRWLWEKYEAWTLRRPDGAYLRALAAHGYTQDGAATESTDAAEAAITRMAAQQAETLLLHELGEAQADQLLGDAWRAMRQALNDRRTELRVRAVRDLLADSLVTLPTLLARGDVAALHFWFANLEGLRAELAPGLAQAYAQWCDAGGVSEMGNDAPLRLAVQAGTTHWAGVCQQVLALHRQHGGEAQAQILALLESPRSRC